MANVAAQSAYLHFLLACVCAGVGSTVIGIFSINELWMLRKKKNPYWRFDVDRRARNWISIGALVSALILAPLTLNGAIHVYKLTPDQFVKEFNAARHR